jgi:hypothetical protein
MINNNNAQSAANCPVSKPNYLPNKELTTFNGFSWSAQGIIHQTVQNNMGNPENWFGNK